MAASPDRIAIVGVGDSDVGGKLRRYPCLSCRRYPGFVVPTLQRNSGTVANARNDASNRCSVALGVKKRALMRSMFTKERTAPLCATFLVLTCDVRVSETTSKTMTSKIGMTSETSSRRYTCTVRRPTEELAASRRQNAIMPPR